MTTGTPDAVREGLLERARHAGADELIVTTNVHDPAERERSFELLAEAFALTPPADPRRFPEIGLIARMTISGNVRHRTATPGTYFGTRRVIFMPAPGGRVDDQAEVVAERERMRSSTLPSPTWAPDRWASSRSWWGRLGVHADAVVLHDDHALGARVLGGDRDRAAVGLARQPVPHGVLDQRLQGQERQHHRQHLGRDLELDVQPVAEAGLLQPDVALDVGELVLQRGELARRTERVAGEVGELDEQLAGPHRVGADERGDGGERVVDEVRGDLRAQRADLGPVEPGARLVELGQLQLAGDVARDLGGGPQQHRRSRW